MTRHHGPHRAARWAALHALLLASLVAGCASPGGGASTNNDLNRCAAALPLAREVVHGNGTLILVRPISRAQVDAITREVGVKPSHAKHPTAPHRSPDGPHKTPGKPPPGPKICLVVYRGTFDAAAIPQAQPAGAHGQYVLIVMRVRHSAVDRVLITDTLPAGSHRSWWHL
jgi:hypothetical protein